MTSMRSCQVQCQHTKEGIVEQDFHSVPNFVLEVFGTMFRVIWARTEFLFGKLHESADNSLHPFDPIESVNFLCCSGENFTIHELFACGSIRFCGLMASLAFVSISLPLIQRSSRRCHSERVV